MKRGSRSSERTSAWLVIVWANWGKVGFGWTAAVEACRPNVRFALILVWFKNHWLQVTLKGAKAALAKGFRVWSVTLI
jgi:hypothetical protein